MSSNRLIVKSNNYIYFCKDNIKDNNISVKILQEYYDDIILIMVNINHKII